MNAPTPGAVRIRKGAASDVDAAAHVLAAAFVDYPWTAYTVSDDNRVGRLFALYRTILADLVVPYGHLWVAETDQPHLARQTAVVGASGWFTPDTHPPTETGAEVAQRIRQLRGDRAAAASAAEALIEAHATDDPHWYLGAIGVAPWLQGRGAGTLLLRPALDSADRQRTAVRLETSSRRNVAFYARHGFRTVAELVIPAGPHCWLMERRPDE